jgi:DNA-binding CsgD family transcriptional regulator
MNELDVLEPEQLADPANPANDGYYDSLRSLRALANSYAERMRNRHVYIVRQTHAGKSAKEIAQTLDVTQNTIYNVLRRDDAQGLMSVLRHTEHLVEGPRLELRRNMLWRIASRNEEEDPNIAISSLKELNKLAGSYPMQVPDAPTQVNIVINGELLPRTALDQAK